MRKTIAEHMVLSRRTSAHVHSVFEVNFSRVAQIREAKKAEYERAGAKLTYMSFIIKAAVDALRAVPIVNASIDGDNVVYHKDINVGIAVALDWGLIVPVDQEGRREEPARPQPRGRRSRQPRARASSSSRTKCSGGTFTITNPGVFGALFGMPIINQPQVAILGVGNVEKRPVVIDDAIAIRPMAYLTLGYDHRIIDGAVADQFMSHVKHALENWDPTRSEGGLYRCDAQAASDARGSAAPARRPPTRRVPYARRSRCSVRSSRSAAPADSRPAAARRASARADARRPRRRRPLAHPRHRPTRSPRAASRCTRPGAAATSPITVPVSSSAIRSSISSPIAATCTATCAISKKC